MSKFFELYDDSFWSTADADADSDADADPDPDTSAAIDTSTLSATTLQLLRPGLLSEPHPFAISHDLFRRIVMTPTADTMFGTVFKSFAHPELVSRSKTPRNAWTLNGEPVAIDTMWSAIQELCLAVVRHLDNPGCITAGYGKELQKARRSIGSMSRVKWVERYLRRVLSVERKA
ncbi:hypothetical protein HK102_012833, partial [Quaeritorhiza haematococci]